MSSIVLAAGESSRLRELTKDIPKCLLELNGLTFLDFQLKNLVECGVKQILIVVGYKKNKIYEHLKKSNYVPYVKIIENNDFKITDNAYSLALALDYINPDKDFVIVLDGDILFDPKLLELLVDSKHQNILVGDNDKIIEPEDNKILVENNFVVDIGKTTVGNAVYTSMIKMSGEFLKKFILEVKKPTYNKEWYSKPLRHTIIEHPEKMYALFTNGLTRCEVDTAEDLTLAKKIYALLAS
jgi:choline kinase